MRNRWALVAAIVAVVTLGAGCGSDAADAGDGGIVDNGVVNTDNADAGDPDADETAPGDSDAGEPDASDTESGNAGSGDAGSIVLGDETIVFASARCFLEEQDAAAGGGKILFVAQGSGTNAAGEAVALDVSRYDEDSQFTGDKNNVVVGDPFSGDAVSWDANLDLGAVSVDGTTVSADGLTWVNTDDRSEAPGSFTVNC